MSRFVSITLMRRGVSCVAELLDRDAPATCEAVWRGLPQEGPVHHAKYARNEIYTMVAGFAESEPGQENPTVTPIPGDLVYFSFPGGMLDRRFKEEKDLAHLPGVIDLAVFYQRNNLLLNADVGWVPGNVYGAIVEGLAGFAEACEDVWRAGSVGEVLRYARYDEGSGGVAG